jgi:lipopolysaccharide/colanic/teichoic acid biosynthesis glycosyltransferase
MSHLTSLLRAETLSAPMRKRIFDILVGTLLLFLVFPLLLLLAIVIPIDSKGYPIYRQWRRGQYGKSFRIYKLRTMTSVAHEMRTSMLTDYHDNMIIFKLPEDPRTTRLGKYLRNYSLDELPQLINVLKGEMSLVGPRPFSIEIFERMSDASPDLHRWITARHQVPPGMTGLWQISGRNLLPPEELVRLDLHYVENWTLKLDVAILIKTLPAVIRRTGAY